ncbi:MAG: class I adenylate-forming enzyme family protein, partial [Bariatricus sp.]|nr:class I adenylate-forming enzyme family protein [Bariatricus sp.]
AKGVLLSNRAANTIAFQYKYADKVLDFQNGERFLDIIPPFLAYGLFFGVHMALCTCLEDVLCPDPAAEHFSQQFLKYKPNHLSGGALHIEALMKNEKVQRMNLSFAKTIAYGGDGMNKSWETDTFNFLKEHHAPYGLMNGYGMTEMAGPVCTSNHKFPVMLPFFCNNIKILDIDKGEELGYEQEGEICVSGPSMMMEYYKNPEATREIIFEENGTRWLRTGDLGHVTKEGYFRLTGRQKRILWSIGADKIPSRVYPMEIENVLSRHSAVDKCAVVGRLNGEKGYLVIAYVTLKSKDTGDNVEKELRQLCREELKENSWPFEYHFVEKLPTTGAGKIDFRTLEKWAEDSDDF